jgi:hypothetical protein
MTEERRRRPAELWGAVWVGVLLVGLGILFYLDSQGIIGFFPGILILVGILILIGGIIGWATGSR